MVKQRREFVASQATGGHDVGTNEDWPVIRGEPDDTTHFPPRISGGAVYKREASIFPPYAGAVITTRRRWQAFADTEGLPMCAEGPRPGPEPLVLLGGQGLRVSG
jgi:hypothetical protein